MEKDARVAGDGDGLFVTERDLAGKWGSFRRGTSGRSMNIRPRSHAPQRHGFPPRLRGMAETAHKPPSMVG
jgi:hypothetical protein